MYYDEPYSRGPRISFSSILLLVIFVGAAGLILAAVIWRPWADDNSSPAVVTPPIAEQPADGVIPADGAVEGEPADGTAPEPAPADGAPAP